jgi:hypothetical protein
MSSKRNQPNAAINAVKAACCPRVPRQSPITSSTALSGSCFPPEWTRPCGSSLLWNDPVQAVSFRLGVSIMPAELKIVENNKESLGYDPLLTPE